MESIITGEWAEQNVRDEEPTPGKSWLELTVPLFSPNSDPISDQEMPFSTLVFRPGLQEIISSLLSRKNTKRKDLQKIYFQFAYYSFFLIHLELKR